MSTSAVTLLIAVQVLAAVALTPLLVGVMRQTRARMEGRAGAGIGQPWRDVRKLMAKEPLRAAGTCGRSRGRRTTGVPMKASVDQPPCAPSFQSRPVNALIVLRKRFLDTRRREPKSTVWRPNRSSLFTSSPKVRGARYSA